MNHKNIGSNLDDFLQEEGILAEVERAAIKEVVASQILNLMQEQKISKVEMSRRMGTSRSALDRLLDPSNTSVSLKTLDRQGCIFSGQEIEYPVNLKNPALLLFLLLSASHCSVRPGEYSTPELSQRSNFLIFQ